MCEAAKIRKSDYSGNRHLGDMLHRDFISQKNAADTQGRILSIIPLPYKLFLKFVVLCMMSPLTGVIRW